MRKDVYKLASVLILFSIGVVIGALSADSDVFLKPPGLRLISDPETVIPASHHYLNQELHLPQYRNSTGLPLEGWSREFVKTRRFSSDQSAWVYFRMSDLRRTKVIQASGMTRTLRIWPTGATLILEAYKGDAVRIDNQSLLEIEVMAKIAKPEFSAQPFFYPVNWSYARFTPDGKSSLSTEKLNECHQCHSIAFRLTGDLVFSRFP
ncbi:MAG: cytochrome P460 family protein [Desulfobacterales bacterium]